MASMESLTRWTSDSVADESISPGKGKSLEECDQELEARYQLQLDELALDFVRQQAEIEHECKEVGHKPQ